MQGYGVGEEFQRPRVDGHAREGASRNLPRLASIGRQEERRVRTAGGDLGKFPDILDEGIKTTIP